MKRLAELRHEAESYGLVHPETTHYTKDELMDKLAKHHRQQVPTQPPLLRQLNVMLARNVKDLPEETLAEMCTSVKWVAEEKLDGVRAKLHLGKKGNRIDSRHRSDVTYEYVEKTNCLPHLRDVKHVFAGTVLDGELIMPVERIDNGKTKTDSHLTSTTATVNSSPERAVELQELVGRCRYFAFDLLFYCGEDVRWRPYFERYDMLGAVHPHLRFVSLPARCAGLGKVAFYNALVKGGGEGVMLKRLDWPYESGKRSKGMYKWKKSQSCDCFVTGFVPGKGEFSGLVGALVVSVMDKGKEQEVAAVQPGDLTFRREISLPDGSLRDDIYCKVLEVTYLCETKNNRLRHAVLKRWRTDKTMYECEGI